jgi:electron-transferring-flavoprotein dehydrogenase
MSEPERESMEVDVLYVGAGPATLASAYHLMKQVEAHNSVCGKLGEEPIEPPVILVIEKSAGVGDHQLSGGVMNPKAIEELMPDYKEQGFPIEQTCTKAYFWQFFRNTTIKLPAVFTPPFFQKKGYHVVSLSDVVKFLAEKCEEIGIEIYPGFAASEVLIEGERVVGVRTGDMGIDRNGKPKSNYQPGMDIIAGVTVFGEGVRGSCTKQILDRFNMHGENEQTYETGIKEIWKVKPEKHVPGRVIHGSMFPDFLSEIHGMWLYDMGDNLVSYGFVTPLASEDPNNDPHRASQEFKRDSPFMRDLLEGAELVRYGAKCVPAGGLRAIPKLYCDGAMLVGDSAGMLNIMKLAGIHTAMKSGMMAADTIIDGLKAADFSAKTLGNYTERFRDSWAYQEHYEARNFTASNEISPLFGMLNIPLMIPTKGRGLIDGLKTHAPHSVMKKIWELPKERRVREPFEPDNVLTFSKEHLVGYSGTAHESDQQPHLKVADTNVCATDCRRDYANPCEKFCPAAVYEMVDVVGQPGDKELFIHHENCVHCKTCDIADPYQIITWTTPQGGEGPDYTKM